MEQLTKIARKSSTYDRIKLKVAVAVGMELRLSLSRILHQLGYCKQLNSLHSKNKFFWGDKGPRRGSMKSDKSLALSVKSQEKGKEEKDEPRSHGIPRQKGS